MIPRIGVAISLICVVFCHGCAATHSKHPPAPQSSFSAELNQWTFQGRPGVSITTPRVQLFTTLPSGDLRDRLPIVLEHTLSDFDRLYLTSPSQPHRVEVFVFNDVAHWRNALETRFGVTYAQALDRGAATSRGVSLLHNIGHADTLRLAAHEVWHAHAQLVLRHPLPTAIDEAIACWAEGVTWDENIALPVRNARNNPVRRFYLRRLVSSGQLGTLTEHIVQNPQHLTASPAAMDAYYARAWALGLFLIESGDASLFKHLTAMINMHATNPTLRNQHPITSSLWWETYFDRSLTDIDMQWRQFANDLAQSHENHP